MKNEVEILPAFPNRCCAVGDGDHEPLTCTSYSDEPGGIPLVANGYLGIWEDGQLEFRICKRCSLVYIEPIQHSWVQETSDEPEETK